MDLQSLRKEIDRIDEALISLLQQRLALSKQVALVKRDGGLPVSDSQREAEIIDRVKTQGGAYGEAIAAIFDSVLETSKALQYEITDGGKE